MIRLQVINYFYLALAILWEPIQRGILGIDSQGRIIFLITILVFFANIKFDNRFLKSDVLSKPALFWGLWVIYSALNLGFNGFYMEIDFIYFFVLILFSPFVVMTIAAKETTRNPEKIFKLFTIVFTIFTVLSVTILGGVHEVHENRLSGEMGNAGPLNAIYVIFFAGLLLVHKKLKWRTFTPLIVFAVSVIAMAGTRKAFGAAIIIFLTIALSQIKFSAKNIVATLILLVSFYFGVNYALENTSLIERFEIGMEVGNEMNSTSIETLGVLGDRTENYIKGWEIFKENPITGIGLKNYVYKNHGPLVIHSEYIVQLAESGIIGSILFFLFYFWIGKNLIHLWRKNPLQSRAALWVLAGGFGAILFINFTAWTYEFKQYFAAFGVMIGYIKYLKNNDSNT